MSEDREKLSHMVARVEEKLKQLEAKLEQIETVVLKIQTVQSEYATTEQFAHSGQYHDCYQKDFGNFTHLNHTDNPQLNNITDMLQYIIQQSSSRGEDKEKQKQQPDYQDIELPPRFRFEPSKGLRL